MDQNQTVIVINSRMRERSFWEYLSVYGVISLREILLRLLSFLGLLMLVALVAIVFFAAVSSLGDNQDNKVTLSLFILAMLVVGGFIFWFLLATITKYYRTSGMPIPFIFALATPFLPFMLLITYFISSKVEREINQALAAEQLIYRKAQREKKKTTIKKNYPSD